MVTSSGVFDTADCVTFHEYGMETIGTSDIEDFTNAIAPYILQQAQISCLSCDATKISVECCKDLVYFPAYDLHGMDIGVDEERYCCQVNFQTYRTREEPAPLYKRW